jgi:alpha-methylacyl-CoA racemase
MGPLNGVRVVEIGSIGPGPFAAMVLADAGAEVIRVDRVGAERADFEAALVRGRRSIALDLKKPEAVEAALRLIGTADVLLEGFRPGVMERLGLGPEECLDRNPALVYGRMTGWGSSGPLAPTSGHDINYIAVSGVLHTIGTAESPVPPLNLVGDFGGGGMVLAFGVVSALLATRSSGRGQVVDAAMTDGSALLAASVYAMASVGMWTDARASNRLDGGVPYYGVYETADGRHVAVGALEPQFYAELLDRLGLDAAQVPSRDDPANWPELRALFTRTFRSRTRDEWAAVFDGSDACVAPVLSIAEAPSHPHNVARGTFVHRGAGVEVAPAPRFSGTPSELPPPAPAVGADTVAILTELGLPAAEVERLVATGTVRTVDQPVADVSS